jgi:DNA-binding PadR family transcriptional regulator
LIHSTDIIIPTQVPELSALGLLQREPLHGYRLKQKLELFMGSCISVNYGAIYPLLKRLEQRGQIQVLMEEAGETGSSRKIYCITDSGRDRWREKMLDQPHESWIKSHSRFMVKYFFFSDLEPEIRVQLLKARLQVCHHRQDYLNHQQIEQLLNDPYQASILERTQTLLDSEIQWLYQSLERLTSSTQTL